MLWMAEQLTIGYYGWRSGDLTTITLRGDFHSRVDMYQNAGTVGLQYLLAQFLSKEEFEAAAGPGGFAQTYAALWGDPWAAAADVLPGNLAQPDLQLPFEPRQKWAFTGGPHPAWGTAGLPWPWSALDFAPAGISGCANSAEWVTASADGYVVRSDDNMVLLNLQGEDTEQAGWVLFYFHVADRDRVRAGAAVKAGDPLGHPSCEGGRSTGTHVHLARKYNGEWIPADGVVPFVLGGWQAQSKGTAYQGRMVRLGAWVEAATASSDVNRVYWVP
jgi:murein DD-endopeptidase MepM/ murein hydrolase activator NlpD